MRLPVASAALALAALVPEVIATQQAKAQTFTTLYAFQETDGSVPQTALIQATDGNLYGTTSEGGANNAGTVFRITPSGTLTTLYSFCPPSQGGGCPDGSGPLGTLVQAKDGNFYGTTSTGGGPAGGANWGTVFRITPRGTLTTLYSFCSQNQGESCPDGEYPYGALVQGSDGNFYGTTSTYDASLNFGYGGTVFKITPSGALTTLYNFCSQIQGGNCTDGSAPYAGLVQATNGDFYGTTELGGANGLGEIFKITASGTLTTIYSFCSQSGCADGEYPYLGTLVQATDGNLYGTTTSGETNTYGTVFKITPGGNLTTLHRFRGMDGAAPSVGVVQATDGNFYGTTIIGGANNAGTVFEISPHGKLTTLYSFCPQMQSGVCPDGENPVAELVQATNGSFYGTTYGGGNLNFNVGTVFSLSVGLGPFVETQPTSGKVGAAVKILGTNLTGSTSVTFNGTAATFTVVSSSEITTTVPAGATTGKVQVVTPSGTLTSNVNFRVRP
jgi:uncharacterized repeat protein (TIGR03803 family)